MDCPNCLTPWKCNGPHLEKSTDNLYSSSEGYYMFSVLDNEWTFIPNEKHFKSEGLLDIINTLNILNERRINVHC